MPSVKIFIADDNESDVRLLSEAFGLISRLITVKHARNTQETIKILATIEAASFDLIILDYYLPPETISEMFEEMKCAPADLGPPVVVWSSLVPPRQRQRLLTSGVAWIAVKPHDLDGLRELARNLIELVETRRKPEG